MAQLYDQAVSGQWNAITDIPWNKLPQLPETIERAIGQVFTFLAENELAALYLPSKFISRIHPAYVETAMFLSTQMADEARHIDVFLKRARAGGGGLGVSSVSTSQSLLSLLKLEDFTEAAFLLSVLGEGTFLDLLTFIEDHAPDEVTAEVVRRARSDEARHVHFGLAHVRHALVHDSSLFERLQSAVRKRATTLASVGGAPEPLQDGLTVLAAGGTDARSIARGHAAFRELLQTMHESRIRRLEHAGFSTEQARILSDLHVTAQCASPDAPCRPPSIDFPPRCGQVCTTTAQGCQSCSSRTLFERHRDCATVGRGKESRLRRTNASETW